MGTIRRGHVARSRRRNARSDPKKVAVVAVVLVSSVKKTTVPVINKTRIGMGNP